MSIVKFESLDATQLEEIPDHRNYVLAQFLTGKMFMLSGRHQIRFVSG